MNQRNVGHVRWRRGLLEHYADGRLIAFDSIVFNIILAQADFRTGAWFGNVWTVEPFLPHDISRKNIPERLQDCFSRLEKGEYVFKQAVQGKKTYVLWVNKYEPTDGKSLNGRASAACGKPVFFEPGDTPSDAPGDQPTEAPSDAPTENRLSGAQVAQSTVVACSNNSNNSKTQELNNSRKNERKNDAPSLAMVTKSEHQPHQVLCRVLVEAVGDPELITIQRKLEEKAKALLANPAGYNVDELVPVLRAALAGEMDDENFAWSAVIRGADNPMAMFAAKVEMLVARHGAMVRRKQATTAKQPPPLQKPGVAESMKFFNQAKKE